MALYYSKVPCAGGFQEIKQTENGGFILSYPIAQPVIVKVDGKIVDNVWMVSTETMSALVMRMIETEHGYTRKSVYVKGLRIEIPCIGFDTAMAVAA